MVVARYIFESLFCQVGCLLFVFGCMFEFLVVTICSQKGDELFSGEVEIFDALAYQFTYIMFLWLSQRSQCCFPDLWHYEVQVLILRDVL